MKVLRTRLNQAKWRALLVDNVFLKLLRISRRWLLYVALFLLCVDPARLEGFLICIARKVVEVLLYLVDLFLLDFHLAKISWRFIFLKSRGIFFRNRQEFISVIWSERLLLIFSSTRIRGRSRLFHRTVSLE